jgi:hypothetical protein
MSTARGWRPARSGAAVALTLNQILGYTSLTGLIQATTTGIPDLLPPEFKRTYPTGRVLKDEGRYTQVYGQRRLPRRVEYGAPPYRAPLADIATKDVKLIHLYEDQPFAAHLFENVRAYTEYNPQNRGIQEIVRQIALFRKKFDNFRTASAVQALVQGKLWFDSAGNFLPTSSGAAVTIDYLVPANNQNQLNTLIGASWATANTDIPGHIRAVKRLAARLTGYPVRNAFYGANIPSYFAANNYVQAFLSRNPPMNAQYLESAELPDLFGLSWRPIYEGFFEDPTGAFQDLLGAGGQDTVVFTPQPSEDWWEVLEGSFAVPTDVYVGSDAEAMMRGLKTVYGMFAYGLIEGLKPPAVSTVSGDTELPVLKVPSSIFIADVVP